MGDDFLACRYLVGVASGKLGLYDPGGEVTPLILFTLRTGRTKRVVSAGREVWPTPGF